MRNGRVKVLFIAGAHRSGSTLLGRLLGQVDSFCSVGELRWVWEEGFLDNMPCACGSLFRSCDFWEAVAEEAFGGSDGIDLRETIQLMHRVDRERHIPQFVFRKSPAYREGLREHSDRLLRLYRSIQEVSGDRFVVDSSKDASYAHILADMPEVDLYVVHLVRDSRAVAHSRMRKKVSVSIGGRKVHMDRYGPVGCSANWVRANLLAETLRGHADTYLRVRYEDLVAAPEAVRSEILGWVGEADRSSANGGKPNVKTDHIVSGNPMRFEQGKIEVRLDEEWRWSMNSYHERLVAMLTWPLLLRYGYPGAGS